MLHAMCGATRRLLHVVLVTQQVVVGIEAGWSIGEDGVAFGPLAAGDEAACHTVIRLYEALRCSMCTMGKSN
jgi:hypothetical protein